MSNTNALYMEVNSDDHYDQHTIHSQTPLVPSPPLSPGFDKSNPMNETSASDPHDKLSLGKAIRQYAQYVRWVLFLSTVILYWGYDSGILSTITSVTAFQKDFGEWSEKENKYIIPAIWLALWSSLGPVGQAVGALTGGWLQDRIGRRKCLLVGSVVAGCAVAVLFLANRVPGLEGKRGMILAGKVMQGYGLAFIKIQTLTYISETAPTSLRGATMALFPTFTLLGQLIGGVVIFAVEPIETELSYLVALGSQWALAIPPFVLSFLLPESPAWLARKKDYRRALKSLQRLLGEKNYPEATLDRLKESIELEERTAAKVSYIECFNAANRRRTFIIIFANWIPTLFGLPLLTGVSYFLQQVGMSSSKSIIFLIAGILCGLIGNACSTWTLSNVGRRKLTITTLLISAGLWAGMGASGIKPGKLTPWITGAFGTTVIVVCGVGAWPASYAISSETSALRLRAKSQAIGGISAYISSILTNFVMPYFYNPDALDLGAMTGFLFTGLCAIGALGMWLMVPEMQGKTVLEIDHLFEEGVSARGSSKWVYGGNVMEMKIA